MALLRCAFFYYYQYHIYIYHLYFCQRSFLKRIKHVVASCNVQHLFCFSTTSGSGSRGPGGGFVFRFCDYRTVYCTAVSKSKAKQPLLIVLESKRSKMVVGSYPGLSQFTRVLQRLPGFRFIRGKPHPKHRQTKGDVFPR